MGLHEVAIKRRKRAQLLGKDGYICVGHIQMQDVYIS